MIDHGNNMQLHDPVQFDPHNPRHSDGTREANMVAGVVAVVGLIAFWSGLLDFLPTVLAGLLLLVATIGAMAGTKIYFSRRAIQARDRAETEYRANIEAETQRKLAEMRAKEQLKPQR